MREENFFKKGDISKNIIENKTDGFVIKVGQNLTKVSRMYKVFNSRNVLEIL